jgi:hypothetical protein
MSEKMRTKSLDEERRGELTVDKRVIIKLTLKKFVVN